MRRVIGAKGRGSDSGYTIVRSKQYNPNLDDPDYLKGSDAPWIARFAQDEGTVMVSGNVNMMRVPQEVLAIQKSGIISFFFEAGWNHWDFFKKSSLLLWHWELVVRTARAALRGDVYRIPASFGTPGALNLTCRAGQLELLSDSPHTATAAMRKVRKSLARRTKKPPLGQGRLGLHLTESAPTPTPTADHEETS